nr:hypothetical protein [Tanacetum cinerariifolium]
MDVYCYYHPCLDDPKKHYGFKLGLLGQSGSLGVDLSKLEMIDDDWKLESKKGSYLGDGLDLPNELGKGRIKETRHLEHVVQQTLFNIWLLLTTMVVAAAKLPILNPNEFDLWKMRIEQYFFMTDYSLWEVILNGDSPPPTKIVDGVVQIVAPTTIKQRLAKKNDLKARGTLLMALPDKHQLKFNIHKDAKSLMVAIEKRFGADLKEQSLDDLFNNLKIYEAEVKGSFPSSQNTQNIAFMSSNNTDSLNESVTAAPSISAASSKATVSTLLNINSLSDAVIYSFFASQSNSPQLDNEDMKQIDPDDLKEVNLKWQMAMLTMRVRRFLKRTGRNLGANGTDTIGFDMSKVKCYNCHRRGHFAREFGGYDWSFQAGEEPTNYALMTYASSGSSSSSGSDNEVAPCFKSCLKAYATLQTYYDNLTVEFRKSQLDVLLYKTGLESVEDRLVVYQNNETVFEEDIKLLKLDVMLRDNALAELRKKFKKAKKERNDLKLTLDKFQTSSKHLSKLLESQVSDKTSLRFDSQLFNSQVFDCEELHNHESDNRVPKNPKNDRYKTGKGYHVVPPPYTKTFLPPKLDLVFTDDHNAIESVANMFHVESDETKIESVHKQREPSFVKSTEHVKSSKESVKKVEHPKQAEKLRINNQKSRGHKKNWNNKACFVCRSLNHLIKDCDYYEKQMVQKPVWNSTMRVNHQNSVRMDHPHSNRNVVLTAVVTRSRLVSFNAARPVPTAVIQSTVKSVIDSGCSRYMTGNISYLLDFKEINGGYVAFGENPKGGKISDTKCVVLSSNYKLPDENHVLLRVPRENNMYNVDLKMLFLQEGINLMIMQVSKKILMQNTTDDVVDAAFDVKENKNDVCIFANESDKSNNKKHDEKAKRGDKGKSHVDSPTRVRDLRAEFKEFSFNNTYRVNAVSVPINAARPNTTNSTNSFNIASPSITAVSPNFRIARKSSFMDPSKYPDNLDMRELEDIVNLDDEEDIGAEADLSNLETNIPVSPIPTTRVHKDHHVNQIISDLNSAPQTRSMTRMVKEQGSKWVFRNKKDEREIVIGNKARLVAQGHTQEEGIDYDEVFAPVERIEAIRLFLAYASFMGFMVYQMDVKSVFLYETIKEEQKDDGIFISQDKYVAKIFRKFGFINVKSASTHIETEKPLLKDPDGEDVDVHIYRSMIGSLMYLTLSRPDIMFAVCAYARFQVTPKVSHLHAVKRIFSDYAGASLNKKSTTRGCQFLCCRLISWQCKKQTVAATSATKAEYFVTAVSYELMLFGLTKDANVNLMLLDTSEGFDQIVDFLNAHTIKWLFYKLSLEEIFFWMMLTELPNEEIFEELARIGYEKPPPKLTFYKAFFSAQWNFFIHTLVQCLSAKRTAWNEFSCSMAYAVICLTIEEVEIPSAPSPPALQDPTPIPHATPPQDQPLTPHASPLDQPTTSHESSIPFLTTLIETCATISQKVAKLEKDKHSQALEILQLKKRVKKLERKKKSKRKHPNRGKIAAIDADKGITLVDVETDKEVVTMDVESRGRLNQEGVSAAETTVFDDEDVIMKMAQTLIKLKAEKAKLLDEQIAQKLHDEEVQKAAARDKQEKADMERALELQKQYDDKEENID